MIRVLHIIPTLDRGGAEKQLALLAAGLPRSEFDVHVCALTRSGPRAEDLQAAGVPLTVIGKRWKLDLSAYWRLKRHVCALRPDIVHTWIFAANCYGRQAALSAGVKHIVAGERCVDPWKVDYELWIDRYLARRTERIITNSTGVREFYASRGVPAEKFTIIPNGIEPFAPFDVPQREEVLEMLGAPRNAKLMGAVGRLWPQKRYKDLLWALDLLAVVRDDVHLVIIGDGPQRWRLEKYRQQMEREGRIHFLGERHDVARFLPHFDCFWLASAYEGQSNGLMEAMSAGLPVVASDIPGNRDLVVQGETGYLVPLGDRAAIARKTKLILEDRALGQRLGAAGRQRMRREFTIEQMIARHAELYRALVAGATPS